MPSLTITKPISQKLEKQEGFNELDKQLQKQIFRLNYYKKLNRILEDNNTSLEKVKELI